MWGEDAGDQFTFNVTNERYSAVKQENAQNYNNQNFAVKPERNIDWKQCYRQPQEMYSQGNLTQGTDEWSSFNSGADWHGQTAAKQRVRKRHPKPGTRYDPRKQGMDSSQKKRYMKFLQEGLDADLADVMSSNCVAKYIQHCQAATFNEKHQNFKRTATHIHNTQDVQFSWNNQSFDSIEFNNSRNEAPCTDQWASSCHSHTQANQYATKQPRQPKPGTKKDPRKSGMDLSQRKQYVKLLQKGIEADVAKSMAFKLEPDSVDSYQSYNFRDTDYNINKMEPQTHFAPDAKPNISPLMDLVFNPAIPYDAQPVVKEEKHADDLNRSGLQNDVNRADMTKPQKRLYNKLVRSGVRRDSAQKKAVTFSGKKLRQELAKKRKNQNRSKRSAHRNPLLVDMDPIIEECTMMQATDNSPNNNCAKKSGSQTATSSVPTESWFDQSNAHRKYFWQLFHSGMSVEDAKKKVDTAMTEMEQHRYTKFLKRGLTEEQANKKMETYKARMARQAVANWESCLSKSQRIWYQRLIEKGVKPRRAKNTIHRVSMADARKRGAQHKLNTIDELTFPAEPVQDHEEGAIEKGTIIEATHATSNEKESLSQNLTFSGPKESWFDQSKSHRKYFWQLFYSGISLEDAKKKVDTDMAEMEQNRYNKFLKKGFTEEQAHKNLETYKARRSRQAVANWESGLTKSQRDWYQRLIQNGVKPSKAKSKIHQTIMADARKRDAQHSAIDELTSSTEPVQDHDQVLSSPVKESHLIDIFFPGSVNPAKILALIEAQNTGIKTSLWYVHNSTDLEGGQSLSIAVDKDSIDNIKNLNYKLNFRFGKVQVLMNDPKLKLEDHTDLKDTDNFAEEDIISISDSDINDICISLDMDEEKCDVATWSLSS